MSTTAPAYNASPSEVANDLEAYARLLERSHHRDAARSMARGAQTIRALMDRLTEDKGR